MITDEQNPGGGAGGGTGMDDHGNNLQSASSTYQIAGNQVVLLSRQQIPPPAAAPGPSRIIILAAGNLPAYTDGKVDVRGSQGVRITTGPPVIPMVSPPVSADSTAGVEIVVAEPHTITIQRGLTPAAQKIQLTEDSIVMQCGSLPVSPKITMTPDGIILSAGGGLSCITLDADGTVVIEGLEVRINGDGLVSINS